MLLAHRLSPQLAIFIVALVGVSSVVLIVHAISRVNFTSMAQYRAQQTAQAQGAHS